MKYLLITFLAALVMTGCKSSDYQTGAYNETANDRHTAERVSNNLRGNSPSFRP